MKILLAIVCNALLWTQILLVDYLQRADADCTSNDRLIMAIDRSGFKATYDIFSSKDNRFAENNLGD